jgi:hypothetical protein
MTRLAAGLFALTIWAGAQPYPTTWNLAHPDAKVLMGLDLHSFRQSALSQPVEGQIQKGSFGMFQLPRMPAAELVKEVDQVLISSPGGKKENPPFLMILTGHFTPEHLREVSKGDTSRFAVLDEQTVAVGDAVSVKGAIDRQRHGAKGNNQLLARAAAIAPTHDLWVVATAPPEGFQPTGVNAKELASYVKGIDLGISFRDGLDFEMSFASKNADAAQEIARYVSEQLQAAMTGKELAGKVQVTSEGSRASVKFALNKDELEQAVRKAQAARAATKPGVDDGKPKSIRIVGLDEGVREIPLPPKKKN